MPPAPLLGSAPWPTAPVEKRGPPAAPHVADAPDRAALVRGPRRVDWGDDRVHRCECSRVIILVLVEPPLWLKWQRTHTHVRLISARIDHTWEAIDDTLDHGILLGAKLTVADAGRHPVRNLTIENPLHLTGRTIKRLGPGERYTLNLPTPLAAQLETEPSITVHLEDAKGRRWRWSPTDDTLASSPPRITPLAYLVQASADAWPQTWRRNRFSSLPAPAQRILWEYLATTG